MESLILFNNNDDMLHNFVLVKPGTAIQVGDLAVKLGLNGSKMNYIPNSANILFHTNLLGPETSETIYITAPMQTGKYTYVCTYPGHSYVMQGILEVVGR